MNDSTTPAERSADEPASWSLSWIGDRIRSKMKGATIGVLIALFVGVVFVDRVVIFVNEGEAGVLFRRFAGGTVLNRVYGEGLHVIFPWNHMSVYDVRVQKVEQDIEVLSSNGLKISVSISMRYRPYYDNLPELHQQVGPEYPYRIVIPEVLAVIRQIFGQYHPEEIYASKRFIIQNTVQNAIFEVSERFVDLDELLITKITLPENIQIAIEEKLQKEQVALGYQYRITSERLEAERKRIEAEGIRDFQQIINSGITENYLRFKGIEATESLAKSPNSKIVIIGGGKDGLPIILDGTDRGGPDVRVDAGSASGAQDAPQLSPVPYRPSDVSISPAFGSGLTSGPGSSRGTSILPGSGLNPSPGAPSGAGLNPSSDRTPGTGSPTVQGN